MAVFKGQKSDVVEVKIESRMLAANVQRKTRIIRQGTEISAAKWTTLKRAKDNFNTVDIFDAVTLEPIGPEADACPSTRYLTVAQKTA